MEIVPSYPDDVIELEAQPLLTAGQVADRLNVPQTWVYRAGRGGGLPCVRMGKYMRFRREDVEDFIAAGGNADIEDE